MEAIEMKSRNPWMLIVLLLLPLLVLRGPGDAAFAAAPASAARRLEISLAQCVEGYIAGSDAVRTAEKKAADSAEAHKRAVAEKKAALSLAELEIAAESAQLALAEARNDAALLAVQAYTGLVQAARDAESKHASLAVAEEKLRVLRLRHQAGLITSDTVLQQENAYLSAKDAVIRADDSLRQAKDDLCRAMAVDLYEEIVLTTDVASLADETVTYDVAECTVLARAASSSYFSAVKSEELAGQKYEALQDPMIAAKAERASAEEALRDAAEKLSNAEKSLNDSVANALTQLDSLIRSLRMQVLSAQLADANLDVARIKFGYGEMLQYELDSEVNSVDQAHVRVAKAKEDLYVQVLKIESMIGRNVADVLCRAGLK
jgi:hypothetical protein